MPIRYQILPHLHLTYIRYQGVIDADQIVTSARGYVADPDFRPGRKELADLSQVAEFDMSYRTLSAMVYRLGRLHVEHGPPHMKVVLAVSDLAYGIGRMVEHIMDAGNGPAVHLARSEAEALQLLRFPETSLAALLDRKDDAPQRAQA